MPAVEWFRRRRAPDLREPTMLVALSGWNDAAEVATYSLRFIAEALHVEPYADVDPETFFVFTELRPTVRIAEGNQRRIEWPANTFLCRESRGSGRDLILVIGTEPHLRWRVFVDTILNQIDEFRVPLLVTVGGLLADVPHTRSVRLTGGATEPRLAERLGRLNVRSSRYEGPTGVLGILGQAARARELPSVSLWGNVPHYINHTPNPKVARAMLRRLDTLLDLGLDLTPLEESVLDFERQVGEAIARDKDAQAYVRQLEDRDDAPPLEEAAGSPEPLADLPSGEEVVRSLEEFLRRRKDREGDGS